MKKIISTNNVWFNPRTPASHFEFNLVLLTVVCKQNASSEWIWNRFLCISQPMKNIFAVQSLHIIMYWIKNYFVFSQLSRKLRSSRLSFLWWCCGIIYSKSYIGRQGHNRRFKFNFEFGLGKGFAPTRLIISIFHRLIGQYFESGILFISLANLHAGKRWLDVWERRTPYE